MVQLDKSKWVVVCKFPQEKRTYFQVSLKLFFSSYALLFVRVLKTRGNEVSFCVTKTCISLKIML